MGALDNLLVVAVEQAVAAPLCTARLAEAGARVIKIERPEGDFARNYDHAVHGESAYFVWLNRGKQSIAMDIKAKEDAILLHRMIARADIFIQNLAPGAAARAGFGSSFLRERYPRLITCDISGYGEEGPSSDMKAYDLLIQCETGLASITGTPDGPGRVGVSVADIACGMNAHAAILQALYERAYTGKGRGIAVSLFDAVADWMTVPLLHYDYGGRSPSRAGLHHPSIAPYGAFRSQDGRELVIAIQNEREWQAFCRNVLLQVELADDPKFATNSLRCANRPLLEANIRVVFGGLPAGTLIQRLAASGTAYAAVNEVADLSRHAQLRRVETQTPTGAVALPAAPARWDGDSPAIGPVPAIDSDGAAIRAEFASQ